MECYDFIKASMNRDIIRIARFAIQTVNILGNQLFIAQPVMYRIWRNISETDRLYTSRGLPFPVAYNYDFQLSINHLRRETWGCRYQR